MLSFAQIILRRFILLFLALFLIVGALVHYWMKELHISQTKESLRHAIELIALEIPNTPDLEKFAQKIHEVLLLRVTFINEAGDVLAESNKDKSLMDNHKYRDEIVAATQEKFGYKIRYSDSVKQHFLYAAKEYKDERGVIYIRLAIELNNINNHI